MITIYGDDGMDGIMMAVRGRTTPAGATVPGRPPLTLAVSLLSLLSLLSFTTPATAANRQIVPTPIVIKNGDTLRIHPGQEMLFAAYAGITVNGHLQAIGTKDRPIVFTSTNDTAGTAAAFDWIGIEITGTGSAEMAYCYISGTTSGITATNPHYLILESCIFENNGQWHLSIAGEAQTVPDKQPYSRKATPTIPTPAALATSPGVGERSPTAAPPMPKAKPGQGSGSRRVWGWTLGSAGAIAAIGGAASLYSAHRTAQDYNAYVPGNKDFDAATPEERQRQYDKWRQEHNTARAVGWSLLILANGDFLYLTIFF